MLYVYGGNLAGEVNLNMADADIVDLRGIARLLKVSKHTPNQWRQRGLLPPTDFPELLRPVWRKTTIIRWAQDTGRWPPGETARPTTRTSPVNEVRPDGSRRTKEDQTSDIPKVAFLSPTAEAAA